MSTLLQTLTRSATRKEGDSLNILTFPTHERYQSGFADLPHTFYMWQQEGIKPWSEKYAKIPKNHVLLNPSRGANQLPPYVDIDIVFSQNKFGQFQIAEQVADQLRCPFISLEHTLPMESWTAAQLVQMRYMGGDINIFISEFSRNKWGWGEDEADVIHHGVDTELFSPFPPMGVLVDSMVEREPKVLSVVNDWINRDWCCGFKIWSDIVGYPDIGMPVRVLGDTPGLSEPAPSTQALVREYQSSRVFLNTSLISPVPTALLEAMSSGCAVVTTATCMIPEIIQNGVNGFISNDIDELREYTNMLLQDEELASRLGAEARKTIEENFSMQAFRNNWNEVFTQCVS